MSAPQTTAGRRARRAVVGSVAVVAALIVGPVAGAAAIDVAPDVPTATDAPIVTAAGSSFTLSASEVDAGSTLTVDYSTDQPDDTNWIGIYRAGQTPGGPASTLWKYAPGTSGSLDFVADLDAGAYDVHFLAKDGYEPLTDPIALTVSGVEEPEPEPEPDPEPDPNAPVPGDPTTPVEIDPVVTDTTTDGVIAREGFADTTAPDGWTVDFDDTMAGLGSDDYRGWAFTTRADWSSTVDEMRDRFGRAHETIAVVDAQQFGDHDFSATLTGTPVPVSGLGAVRLTFDSHYRGAPGQSAVVTVSFDGTESTEVLRLDDSTVASGYDALQMNGSQDLAVDVPTGATNATFSWAFTGNADSRYWAIDSVAVHQALAATAADPTQALIVSDIQGDPGDFAQGLEDFNEIAPNANGLLMVGDIVASGSANEWVDIYDVMANSTAIRPEQTVAAIGNHERYAAGGFGANRDRFLAFAERDKVWDEYVLDGPAGDVPVIVLGQEFGGPTDVAMSEEQVRFLEDRLAYWTELDKQVVVITHFPLGDTVSASWIPSYSTHHQHNDRLTSILGNYPNAIIFTGHTHYPAEEGDWAMQRRTADGHPDGFWAVNTLAMETQWNAVGENTAGITEVTSGDISRGLTLDSYGDRIVVSAYDFDSDEQLRQVTIPNPLVPFAEIPGDDIAADYSAVDAALATVPSSLSGYTPESVAVLTAARDAVVRGLLITDQARVDAMAAAIRDAVAALVEVPAGTPSPSPAPADPAAGDLAVTGSDTNPLVAGMIAVLLAAGGALLFASRRRRAAGRG